MSRAGFRDEEGITLAELMGALAGIARLPIRQLARPQFPGQY